MIKVIIERQIKEGQFQNYFDLIRRARKQATAIAGFIAGEILQEKNNQNHAMIISSWENFDAWEKWLASSEREEALSELKPFLDGDEKITVLEGTKLL
ncbi:MAG: antibiotic biosynthesis monooxygenase [Gammaproteobacteria bacterium]|nr:antibiotic biosynthesis monooxygenase [Gammaproteobacteria bacterium]MDH5631118.1 antibiotic biosynthesis monooxygenase [Gammaproteobacteria bacterium]